jgi:hypothetical protein
MSSHFERGGGLELSFSRDALGIVIDGVITGPRGMKRVKFLLGLNFLKHFRLTLDFPNGKLIME